MSDDQPGIGELRRQVAEVLSHFRDLSLKLETMFVSKGIWDMWTLNHDQAATDMKARIDKKASQSDFDNLKERVVKLEDNQKWLVRIVLAFVVMGILGAVFVTSAGK